MIFLLVLRLARVEKVVLFEIRREGFALEKKFSGMIWSQEGGFGGLWVVDKKDWICQKKFTLWCWNGLPLDLGSGEVVSGL